MKKQSKNSKNNIIYIIILIIGAVLGYFSTNGDIINTNSNYEYEELYSVENLENEDLKIYFFDVGQADSILAINNNETILIDAGNNEDGEKIVDYIESLGITKIDYIVGTHLHEDHIGGLDDVIDNFEIENVLLPYSESKTTKTYEDVLDSIANKGLSLNEVQIGDEFNVGDVNCEIMYVDNDEPADDNDASICIRMSYIEQSYLLMGDASTNVEEARNWPQTNVLKVGHHGSKTSTSESFLRQVEPKIAIIQVGQGNSYGHPTQEVLERLKNICANVFRTDENGTILLVSDGINNAIKSINVSLDGNK